MEDQGLYNLLIFYLIIVPLDALISEKYYVIHSYIALLLAKQGHLTFMLQSDWLRAFVYII